MFKFARVVKWLISYNMLKQAVNTDHLIVGKAINVIIVLFLLYSLMDMV